MITTINAKHAEIHPFSALPLLPLLPLLAVPPSCPVVRKTFPVVRTLVQMRGNLFRTVRKPFRVVAEDVRPLAPTVRGISRETPVDSWKRPQPVGIRPVDCSGDRVESNA